MKIKSIFKEILVFLFLIIPIGCDNLITPGNVINLGKVKVELSEYFKITLISNLELEIPCIVHTPEGKYNGTAYVYCYDRVYYIQCQHQNCKKYEKFGKLRFADGYYLDRGTFEFKSIWADYCKSAAGKNR